MTEYTGHTFQGGRVALDGNSFKGCTFDSCELVFSGGIPPALSGCSFRNTSMKFEGTAGNTIAFLKAMLEEIESFFGHYASLNGKQLEVLARKGPRRAHKLLKAGARKFEHGR